MKKVGLLYRIKNWFKCQKDKRELARYIREQKRLKAIIDYLRTENTTCI